MEPSGMPQPSGPHQLPPHEGSHQQPHPSGHQKGGGPDSQTIALSRQVSDMLSRLRLMEERYANLRREHQLTSQNMIENHQGVSKQQRRLSETITELKRTLQELAEQIDIMQGELSDTATIHDIKAVERYLDLWQPLDFITREEARKIIAEALQEKVYKAPSAEQEQGY